MMAYEYFSKAASCLFLYIALISCSLAQNISCTVVFFRRIFCFPNSSFHHTKQQQWHSIELSIVLLLAFTQATLMGFSVHMWVLCIHRLALSFTFILP
uniref:Secreted protein n=1 Tax=Amblyomma parvum TaxID=251391 RepID=A0A023G266_AMBPA